MKDRIISIPSFLMTQVNKKTDGTLKTQKEILIDSISEAIDCFEGIFDFPENCALLCFREAIGDDYKYALSITTTSLKDIDQSNILYINVPEYKELPTIVINETRQNLEE
jgi:hypothetical protein